MAECAEPRTEQRKGTRRKYDPGLRGWLDTQPEGAKGEGNPTEPQIPCWSHENLLGVLSVGDCFSSVRAGIFKTISCFYNEWRLIPAQRCLFCLFLLNGKQH